MLVFSTVICIFAGCSGSREIVPVDTPFAIYCQKEDITLKLGDNIEDIGPVLGPVARMIVEIEEFNYERVDYHETPDVYMDYKPDGTVFGLRFANKDWQLANGLTIGSKPEDIKNAYPEADIFEFAQTDDLWIAYDENKNLIEFSESAPYIIRFKIKSGVVTMIVIKDNSMDVGIF